MIDDFAMTGDWICEDHDEVQREKNMRMEMTQDKGTQTTEDEIQQHLDIFSALGTIIGTYGDITVGRAIENIHARLVELQARKKTEDEASFEKIRKQKK